MAKLKQLYAFVIVDKSQPSEGLITLKADNTQGEVAWLPITTPFEKDLPQLQEIAQGIGRQLGKEVILVRFTRRQNIKKFKPSVNRVYESEALPSLEPSFSTKAG